MAGILLRATASCLLTIPLLTLGCETKGGVPMLHTRELGCAGCTVLEGGMVFDGTRAGPGVVVLQGSRVKEVSFDDVEITSGDIVDVSGKTVLPGLIDLHAHSQASPAPYGGYGDLARVEDVLKAMLRAGVTSYLDLGSSKHVIFDYRSRLQAGALLGPRLLAVGPLLSPTGGHPCYGQSPGDFCVLIDSPADVDTAFPGLIKDAPDFVKIVIDSGVVKPIPQLSNSAIAAIEQAAEASSLRVIAHVSAVDDVEDALAAGVKLFAHLPIEDRISADLANRMAAAKVVVVPTLAIMDTFFRIAHGTFTEIDDPALGDDVPADVISAFHDPDRLSYMTSPSYKALTKKWRDNAIANFKACHAAGVTMVSGTDAGNPGVFHGLSLSRELASYVDAGMTPREALVAGTRAAADVLGRPELGRLQAGGPADVLVIEGDPLADIHALERVSRVYRAGVLVDRDALALPRNTSLVVKGR